MNATACTVIGTEVVSSPGAGSSTAEETEPPLANVPATTGKRTTVAVALWPPAIVPKAQLALPLTPLQVPAVVLIPAKVALDGNVASSVVPGAGSGPLFVTV